MARDGYEETNLWQSAFSPKTDGLDREREKFTSAYKDFRARVTLLLAQIQRELPDLTLHDITHIDALWRIASEIAGPKFSINPAEAFVLGGAFLLHDAAHCRAAFSGGIAELRQTIEWRDAAAQRKVSPSQVAEGSLDFQAVLFDTLRVLHPKQARKLPFANWQDESGNSHFLFPHDELREAYGSIIGEIAESHWYDPQDLEKFANKVVAAPVYILPAAWTVNSLKIAVLLRVSDAAHIDAVRAPRLIGAINRPSGISLKHWQFQARMNQPHCDVKRGELLFSSSPFPASEQDAWWLAYDTARMADKEIAAAAHLLRDNGIGQLAAKEVSGIRTPESFARNVPTVGWDPIDASLRINNVQSIVDRFGGAKLYGDAPYLALRELLQNAKDAVMACRALGALEQDEGSISVELVKVNDEDWLNITDTGIGMSRYVLVHVLLDFGRSLWKDASLLREWPGLAATGFEATGRFGIGFFSIFMLGKQVKITTRRQFADAQQDSQWVLEFSQGLDSRPSLRKPSPNEFLRRSGTCISVKLFDPAKLFKLENRSFNIFGGSSKKEEATLTLNQLIGALAPALEVTVFTKFYEEDKVKTISAGDWKDLDSKRLMERISPGASALLPKWPSSDLDIATNNISLLVNEDSKIVGRCAITDSSNGFFALQAGVITVDGLYVSPISGFAGILCGKQSELLNRSVALPEADKAALSRWAENQANSLRQVNKLNWNRSSKLLALGAKFDELPIIVTHNMEDLTTREFKSRIIDFQEIWLVEYSDRNHKSSIDEVLRTDFENHLQLDSRVFS